MKHILALVLMVFGIVSCAPPEYEEFGFTNELDFKTAKDLGFINASDFNAAKELGFKNADDFTIAREFGLSNALEFDIYLIENLCVDTKSFEEVCISHKNLSNSKLLKVLISSDPPAVFSMIHSLNEEIDPNEYKSIDKVQKEMAQTNKNEKKFYPGFFLNDDLFFKSADGNIIDKLKVYPEFELAFMSKYIDDAKINVAVYCTKSEGRTRRIDFDPQSLFLIQSTDLMKARHWHSIKWAPRQKWFYGQDQSSLLTKSSFPFDSDDAFLIVKGEIGYAQKYRENWRSVPHSQQRYIAKRDARSIYHSSLKVTDDYYEVGINGESFKFDRKLGTATSQINATGFKFKTGYECGSVSAKEQKKYFKKLILDITSSHYKEVVAQASQAQTSSLQQEAEKKNNKF
jgi:hypothetical protein